MRYRANKKVSCQRRRDPHQKQYVANAKADGIRTKNDMSPSPSVGDITKNETTYHIGPRTTAVLPGFCSLQSQGNNLYGDSKINRKYTQQLN